MIYRQGRNYENLNKMIYRGTGKFDTPCLVPEVCNADSFIGFNYAKSCKDPQHKGVHFFIDDYQFTRLWTNPDAYLDMLRAFKCVLHRISAHTPISRRQFKSGIIIASIGSVHIGRVTESPLFRRSHGATRAVLTGALTVSL